MGHALFLGCQMSTVEPYLFLLVYPSHPLKQQASLTGSSFFKYLIAHTTYTYADSHLQKVR